METLTRLCREWRKYSVKARGLLGLLNRFHFLIIGAAKCGTTSLHNYLRAHPDIYMPSLDTGVNGETGFFLDSPNQSIKGLSNADIAADPADILATYGGEPVIGERSTDYTKRPYRSVRMEEIHPDTKIIFLYRDPIDRVQKMYNHHLNNKPKKTSKNFRDENVDYYIQTSMYYYQAEPWVAGFDSFCAANINVDDHLLFPAIIDFLGLPPADRDPSERKNVNRTKDEEIYLTDDERSRLLRDFDQFQSLLESTDAVHIAKETPPPNTAGRQ